MPDALRERYDGPLEVTLRADRPTVLANFVAMSQGTPPAWITYSPLPPLALLLFSGLYLFALPYMRKGRSV